MSGARPTFYERIRQLRALGAREQADLLERRHFQEQLAYIERRQARETSELERVRRKVRGNP